MSTVKIQVPLDKELRDKLEARATKLGFDSVQAYIRFWATAETDGRRVNFDENDGWGEPSPAAGARLDKISKEVEAGVNVSGPFYTADEFLEDLHK